MNYSLAKRLKDAGFPQKSFIAHVDDSGRKTHHYESYYCPTLSELIEWCKLFPNYHFSLYGRDHNRWEATAVSMNIFGEERKLNINSYCSTPEEAVANLGVALHKK